MKYTNRCRFIANSYYNLGLEKAKIRDLTGAAESLQKSLRFNKYQTDARNLLGLIYYEIGEVAEALVQWVISMNLQKENNIADRYLEEIQRKPGRLEIFSQNIMKYNQALSYAQNGSDDLAVLQLTRVVEDNPHFVKAQLLLSALYMSHNEYIKAGKALYRILQIDKNNPKALWYMSLVKENTGKADAEKRKLRNVFSHRQMEDDDIIMPPTYHENTGWQTLLNIIIGLLMGVGAMSFLVLPAQKKIINNSHNQEMLAESEKLNGKNLEVDELTRQLSSLSESYDEAKNSLDTVNDLAGYKESQYETLIRILQDYRSGNVQAAVEEYSNLDREALAGQHLDDILSAIEEDMKTAAPPELQALGEAAASRGDIASAIAYYNKGLEFSPGNLDFMLQLALVYKSNGDTAQAVQLFDQIIAQGQGTEQANRAREERGY